MNDDEKNKGLIHPDGVPPGFRSPYLPNWNGAENEVPKQQYYRSQSVVISTGPDGKTTKTTTIRDSDGQTTTTTEEYGNNDFYNNNDDENNNNFQLYPEQKHYPKLFERTDDPFEKFRNLWQKWKWNPFPWKNKNDDNGYNNNDDTKNWFWGNKNGNNEMNDINDVKDNNEKEG
eukprot:67968_1